jgi:hypothetical protein
MHNYININSCRTNSGISKEEDITTLRTSSLTQRLRVHLDQTLQSRSQALQRQRRTSHQRHQKIIQCRQPRPHRLRKSNQPITQGAIVHSRSSVNQYFNFHYMYGGFKKWAVDRYLVGSIYRNGFRVMWFPALLYYVCTYFITKSVATT